MSSVMFRKRDKKNIHAFTVIVYGDSSYSYGRKSVQYFWWNKFENINWIVSIALCIISVTRCIMGHGSPSSLSRGNDGTSTRRQYACAKRIPPVVGLGTDKRNLSYNPRNNVERRGGAINFSVRQSQKRKKKNSHFRKDGVRWLPRAEPEPRRAGKALGK